MKVLVDLRMENRTVYRSDKASACIKFRRAAVMKTSTRGSKKKRSLNEIYEVEKSSKGRGNGDATSH